MAATIIYLVISLLVSLIFIILGIMQYRSEKPVSIIQERNHFVKMN